MNKWKKKYQHTPKPKPIPPKDIVDLEALTGTVENIVYRSEDTGYTVCSVRVPGQIETMTVVGACPAVWIGEMLKVSGKWVRHKQHGYQFQAETMACVAPTSAKGIERYLASGMIRGIGKVNAARLVEAFGEDTLRVIDKESQKLENVEGIGPKRRKMIKESWIEQHSVRDIMIFLQSHGVGTAQSARIFRHYGDDAIAMITDDPYRLCRDIWGIGFKKADGVAMSLGIPPQSDIRARAGLVYTMQTMSDEGHCFCPEPELILQAQDLLDIPAEILSVELEHELKRQSLIKDQDRIYLAPLYDAETEAAAKIIRLLDTDASFKPIVEERAIPWAAENMRLTFDPTQEQALKMALSSKVSIMTGGPGVGKTTIIRALVDVFTKRKLSVSLAAPTGRAAKRMEESTGRSAKTVHRLLKFMPKTGGFDHNASNPLEGNVFILDEVSMMDILLMNAFLSALPNDSCLILVGDIDQLPSIGAGNVLRDMINSGAIPCTKLNTIFRQESGGLIVQNAHHINQGDQLETADSKELSDFYFLEADEPDQVIERMLSLISDRIPKRFGFSPMADIQLLTPMRKNQLGAENLNAILQEKLNPHGESIERFGRKYRKGDRVMQIRNNYDKEVFNGDIGNISLVDTINHKIEVSFDNRQIAYEYSELDEIVLAYACSIHKSQGSEYPAVVILMATQHFKLLQRNLLYTAITRGRDLVCLVGSKKAIGIATRNNEIRLRRTGLRERLAR